MQIETPHMRSARSLAPAERRVAAWRLPVLTGSLIAIGVLLLGGGGLLWARHGSAIFFDMVAAGIATCF